MHGFYVLSLILIVLGEIIIIFMLLLFFYNHSRFETKIWFQIESDYRK